MEDRLLTRVFVLAWFAQFFHNLATNAYVHFPGFLKTHGASELAIGTLFGATAALAITLRMFLGAAMNRYGRRPFIRGAGVLHVMLCATYCALHRLSAFVYVLRAVHGIVEAVIFSILFTYAADIVPAKRRTEGIAWFGVSGQIPIALGGFVGDWILARTGYEDLFFATVVFAALGFVVSIPLPEPARSIEVGLSRGFVACATQRDLLPLFFIGVVFTTGIAPVFVFLKTYVMHAGVGSVGLVSGLYSLSAAALRLFFGWVPDRVGPKKALGPAILAVAFGMMLLARASGPSPRYRALRHACRARVMVSPFQSSSGSSWIGRFRPSEPSPCRW